MTSDNSNVIVFPKHKNTVAPRQVLQSVMDELQEGDSVFVLQIDKNFMPRWYSSTVAQLTLAWFLQEVLYDLHGADFDVELEK